VSASFAEIKEFLEEKKEIILKPLNNCFGTGVMYLKKGDKNSEQAMVAAILGVKNPENALSAEIVKAYEKSSDALKVKAFDDSNEAIAWLHSQKVNL
jgi:glutathione synthase/RimK-type ligase-like ATP-grasp enzyme